MTKELLDKELLDAVETYYNTVASVIRDPSSVIAKTG